MAYIVRQQKHDVIMTSAKKLCTLVLLVVGQFSSALADQLPSASLQLIQDRFTDDYHLLATIDAVQHEDLRIKGVLLFDPSANVDVTRASDGEVLPNLAGGFNHVPYMRDLIVPRGVGITVVIPLPKNQALLPLKPRPGDYFLKLRYFTGQSLRIRVLADGSMVPSDSQLDDQDQQAEQDGTGQPAKRPESKSDDEPKTQPESEPGPR